jgi:hypothetical protein
MILKGQNFRILFENGDNNLQCIGMATNCSVTLTGNTENSEHKDIVGNFALPGIVSKSWQVQVDSLDVADTAAMLTAIKSGKKFRLQWDKTTTSDNQTPQAADYAYNGEAFLTDATFQFDNRTNSTKSLQFSGTGALSSGLYTEDFDSVTPAGFTKGQFVRLFLGSDNIAAPSKPLASALTCSLHVSVSLESATTKDTTGDWEVQEPTGISYDISTSAMMENDETITSQVQGQTIANLETIYNNSQPVKFKIANTSGANNRTAGATIVSGSVVITSLELQGPNRQTSQYNATLQGYGPYLVGA